MKNTLSVLHPGVETGPVVVVPAKDASAKTAKTAGSGLAARLSHAQGLRGRRVALLENTKVNAAELLTALAKRLAAHGIGEVRMFRKRHAGESGAAAIADILKWQPDLVLTGLGD
jgi:nucleotide-binding universal stress UspA family protein